MYMRETEAYHTVTVIDCSKMCLYCNTNIIEFETKKYESGESRVQDSFSAWGKLLCS
jgi:hypothetical protein